MPGLQDHHRDQRGQVRNIGPLQDRIRSLSCCQRSQDTADRETSAQQHQPCQWTPDAGLPIAPDPGNAGRRYLGNQRNALRDMLFHPKQQNREHDQPAAGAYAEKPRCDPADKADANAAEKITEHHSQAVSGRGERAGRSADTSPSSIWSTAMTQASISMLSPQQTWRTNPWNSAMSVLATASALTRREICPDR